MISLFTWQAPELKEFYAPENLNKFVGTHKKRNEKTTIHLNANSPDGAGAEKSN